MARIAAVIIGTMLLLGGTIGCFMLAGHSPAELVWFVPSLAMFLIPVGCSLLAFGVRGPLVVLHAFAALWCPEYPKAEEASRVVSACIGFVYGAGAFVFFASLLSILDCIPIKAGSGVTVGFGVNVEGTLASLIYPVVLAEMVLRPLKHRLDCLR